MYDLGYYIGDTVKPLNAKAQDSQLKLWSSPCMDLPLVDGAVVEIQGPSPSSILGEAKPSTILSDHAEPQ